jgi:hypothetical protein
MPEFMLNNILDYLQAANTSSDEGDSGLDGHPEGNPEEESALPAADTFVDGNENSQDEIVEEDEEQTLQTFIDQQIETNAKDNPVKEDAIPPDHIVEGLEGKPEVVPDVLPNQNAAQEPQDDSSQQAQATENTVTQSEESTQETKVVEEPTESFKKAILTKAVKGLPVLLVKSVYGFLWCAPYVWSALCCGYDWGCWGGSLAKDGVVNVASKIPFGAIKEEVIDYTATKVRDASQLFETKAHAASQIIETKARAVSQLIERIPTAAMAATEEVKRLNVHEKIEAYLENMVNSYFPKGNGGNQVGSSRSRKETEINGMHFEIPRELQWLEDIRLELLAAFSKKVNIHRIYRHNQVEDIAIALTLAFSYVMDLKYACHGSPAIKESDLEPIDVKWTKSVNWKNLFKEYSEASARVATQNPDLNVLIVSSWKNYFKEEAILGKIFSRETLEKMQRLSDEWTPDQLKSIKDLLEGTDINVIYRYLIPHYSILKEHIFSQTTTKNPWNALNPYAIVRLNFLSRNKVTQQRHSWYETIKNRPKLFILERNKSTSNFWYFPALVNGYLKVDKELEYEAFHKTYLYCMMATNQRRNYPNASCSESEKFGAAKILMTQLLRESYEISHEEFVEIESKIPLATGSYGPLLSFYQKIYEFALNTRRKEEAELVGLAKEAKKLESSGPKGDKFDFDEVLLYIMTYTRDGKEISAEEDARIIKGLE